MSSVRELQIKQLYERRKLIQALSDHLVGMGMKADISRERMSDYSGYEWYESIINLQGQNVSKIRLVDADNGGCESFGHIMRFQYEVRLEKELAPEKMRQIGAATNVIKDGKVGSDVNSGHQTYS